MGNLSDYFDREGYRATWRIGDRVRGRWNRIPFVGTVGNDRLVSPAVGPEVTVHLDLPVMYQGKLQRMVVVKPGDLKRLD